MKYTIIEGDRTNVLTKRGKKINIGCISGKMTKNQKGLYLQLYNITNDKKDGTNYLRYNSFDDLNCYQNRYFPMFDKVKYTANISGIGEVKYFHYVLSEKGKRRLNNLKRLKK